MSDQKRPTSVSTRNNRMASQSRPMPTVEQSFESPTAQAVAAGAELDVQGVAYVFAYGGGAVTCCDTATGSFVALQESASGTVVTVTTARLIEVRGVHYIKFASAATVVFAG
jgi:hypothetical protein